MVKQRFLKVILGAFIGIGVALSFAIRLTTEVKNYPTRQYSIGTFLLDVVSHNSIVVGFVLFAATMYIVFAAIPKNKTLQCRDRILIFLAAFVISASIVIPPAQNVEPSQTNVSLFYSISTLYGKKVLLAIVVVETFFIAMALYNLAVIAIAKINEHRTSTADSETHSKLDYYFSKYVVLKPLNVVLLGVAIFLCWIPIMIANGPVIVDIDTIVQLIQYKKILVWDPKVGTILTGYRLSDHHPFVDTYIYGLFDDLGMKVGNELLGLEILTWLQYLLGATSLALVI
ncbi:MAG: hypothetical protein HUJ62_00320, partial [Streptococcus gallolyticus]|nr:hypothetical protein [Streptococcus gallolyticus]